MGQSRSGKPPRALRALLALLVTAFMLVQGTPAFAATTGILSGTVVDAGTHAPIAGVTVTATAPSGHYQASTDAHGFYSIAGVYSDTYTVSFQAGGYQPVSMTGETVFPDQTLMLNAQLEKELRTIAQVRTRSAGGAFQPNQTTDTYNVTPKQLTTINGNAANFNESNLITSLPGGSLDAGGYPVIRGGRENEENFEFEGIPYTDAFTNQFANTLAAPGLGLQSIQLTPGLGSAAGDNYGTGTFNLVAKRGTYPGFATVQPSIGGPAFRHGLNVEYGFASPNGRISNYISIATDDIGRAYGSLGTNCLDIGTCFSRYYQTDREVIDNLVFKFGHNDNQQLQFFIDTAQHNLYYGYGGFNNFNNLCFRTCDPLFLSFALGNLGWKNTPANQAILQSIMTLEKYQSFPTETLGYAHRSPYTYFQPNQAMKLGYTWSVNSSTYLQAMAFKQNDVTTFDFPMTGYSSTASSKTQEQGGITNGLKLDITSQLNEKNVAKVGAMYRYLVPVFDDPANNWGIFNQIFTNGETPDFLSTSQCAALGNPKDYYGQPCGYIYNNGVAAAPAGTKVPDAYENSQTTRQDWALYADDTWSVNERLKLEGGLRVDIANYRFPGAAMNLNTCTSLYYPQYVYNSSGQLVMVAATNPNVQTSLPKGVTAVTPDGKTYTGTAPAGFCPAATFNLTKAEKNPVVPEPVLSASYRLGANDQVRASWGRSVEFATLALVDFSANPNYFNGPGQVFTKIPGYAKNCGVLGDQKCLTYAEQLYWDNADMFAGSVPLMPVRPTVFTNADFSWSHQFTQGFLNGVAFKITPYWRKAQDETALSASPLVRGGQIVTNPQTGAVLYGPTIASNKGKNQDTGVELQITRDALYGLSGQLSMTYQNEFSSVIPLTGSEDFYPSIPPSSLNLGNTYRVGFLSPFVASLDLSYQTHNGWRIAPQIQYNVGYPISPGLLTSATINGTDVNIANTNASLALTGAPGGTNQYVDPQNPGSFFNPNVVATRGIDAKAVSGGVLSHPSSTTNLTIEYNGAKRWTAGLQVFNLFSELYGGPVYNSRYQPVANGISGPLSGLNSTAFLYPQFGNYVNYGANRYGQNAYIDTPSGLRTYYLYTTIKL